MTEDFYSDVRRGARRARKRGRVKFVSHDMHDNPHYPLAYPDCDFAAEHEYNAQSVVNSPIGVSSEEDTIRYATDHYPRRDADQHPQSEPKKPKWFLMPIFIPIYILIQIGKSFKRK